MADVVLQPAFNVIFEIASVRMDISTGATDPLQTAADLVIILCHEEAFIESSLVARADLALEGVLSQAIADERFAAKPGQIVSLHTYRRLEPRRLALLGCGPRAAFGTAELRVAAGRAARHASSVGARSATLALPEGAREGSGSDPSRRLQTAAEGLLLGAYRFDRYLGATKKTPSVLETFRVVVGGEVPADADAALDRARETARAVAETRDLVNEPAGFLTPRKLAAIAETMATEAGLQTEILGPAACRELGMGLYLAVAQGSAEEPRFIHLAWKPAGARKRIVLVGKGVTFDSGGLSLKTNEGMLDMKVDMAGAATVMSAVAAAARQKLPIEVHALGACTENMPSGTSYKLGDVLRSMAGRTVEINNTDAEGRLTLADALTFGLRLKPDAILDFATLTGACIVALGPHTAGVMSNNDALLQQWLGCAKTAGEEMWSLPLPGRLADQLKSEIADTKNTGERWGGALTAGLFLREFVGETPWVHVDLAGPASADKEFGHIAKGGTGFGVATILEYLRASSL